MYLDCSRCATTVEVKAQGCYEHHPWPDPERVRYSLFSCTECGEPIVTDQYGLEVGPDQWSWSVPRVVFPVNRRGLGESVPAGIRQAFEEALDCFHKASAYTATAVMCRKVLEAVCESHGTTSKTLVKSLQELRDNGVIDARLSDWAHMLRLMGNEAAHGVGTRIARQDAVDIIEFARALLEYVFTYRERFEEFKKRRTQPPPAPARLILLESTSAISEPDRDAPTASSDTSDST